MERSKIIRNSMFISKIAKWGLIGTIVVTSVLLIHSAIAPETYRNFEIRKDQTTLSFNLSYCSDCERTEETVYLSDMGIGIRMWVLIRYALISLFLILIINRVIEICKSVEVDHTFYNNNVAHLKQMSKYASWIFMIGLFNFIDEGHNGIGLQLGFPFGMLAFSLMCLTLSEVFREGSTLLQDKNAIV